MRPMASPDPTTRLTEREKVCLRLWLEHKTAKEIALDLGISHHAVEKRLKMARTKLDADTWLEAARMLANAEGCGQAEAGPPEVPTASVHRKSWLPQPLALGGFAMFFASLVAVGVAVHQPAEPAEIEFDNDFERLFEHLDRDDSGYLEDPESPFVAVAFVDPQSHSDPEGQANLADARDSGQVAAFYRAADTDADGRISFHEYHSWSEARWAELGIEVSNIVKVLPAPES